MVVVQFEFAVGGIRGRRRPGVFNDLPDLAMLTFLYSGRDPDQQKHCTQKASANPNHCEITRPIILVTALLVKIIVSRGTSRSRDAAPATPDRRHFPIGPKSRLGCHFSGQGKAGISERSQV